MSKRLLLALFVSPILVAGTAALADDGKIFPGIMCQPEDEGIGLRAPGEEDRFLRRSNGSITHIEPPPGVPEPGEVGHVGRLFCPIVRDIGAANTFEFASITVALRPALDHGAAIASSGPRSPSAIRM
jgi:hypothetical protein